MTAVKTRRNLDRCDIASPVSVTTWQHVIVSLLWFALSAQWMTVVPIIVPDQVAVILGGDSAAKSDQRHHLAAELCGTRVAPLSGGFRTARNIGTDDAAFLIAGSSAAASPLAAASVRPGASLCSTRRRFIFLQFW